jgi:CPA1 family monovalent cation:H+ antiporter
MRGAVTVAAAQTLPADTPQRSVLVLIAFAVAMLSLLIQGGTIGPLLRRIMPEPDREELDARESSERAQIFELMKSSADSVPALPAASRELRSNDQPSDETLPGEPAVADFDSAKRHRLAVIAAQRSALLDARDNGTFDADVLEAMLANLDASQIDIEMRGAPVSER